MAKALRAADIRGCIHCFTACGKPCGEAGRACAVSCGVCINNCRGGCCGLGTCCAGIGNCCAGICTFLCQSIKVVLVVTLVLVGAFLVYVYWDPIVSGTEGFRNGTVQVNDRGTVEDSNVLKVWNKTEEYYGAAKDKINEIGSHVDNTTEDYYGAAKDKINEIGSHVGNKTVKLYGAAKDQVVDAYEKVSQSETVQSAVNGTVGFFNSLKEKLWG